MRFIVSIFAGLLGAALGLLAGWLAGEALARALDVSCFEGACGYFVALIALVGGLIGLIAGILAALRWRGAGKATAGRAFGQLVGALAVIAGLAVGGTWLYAWVGDDTLGGSNQATPQLYYEIRFPAGTKLPRSVSGVDVQLDTEKNQAWGDLFDDWHRRDGDRPVVAGFFDLYYRANSRVLSIKLPETVRYVFVLKLPRAPGHMADYTDWYPPDYIDEGTSDQPQKATGDVGVDIRYRVVYAGQE